MPHPCSSQLTSAEGAETAPGGRFPRYLGALPAGLLIALLASSTGCSDARIDQTFKRVLSPRRSAQQYMLIAVSDEDPDMRRSAVARVAKSKQYKRNWAVKGFIAIALLESDSQARCVAIRALARTEDPRAVETILKILNHRDHPPADVRPPDDLCRWDAAEALAQLSAAGAVPVELRAAAQQTLGNRLRLDTERHARIAAARGLSYYPDAASVQVLIEALRDSDFAVTRECELALVRLTGCTHDCDVTAWNSWFEANRDNLFARAGEIPESRRPPYNSRLGKFAYDTKQVFRWLVPAKKEQ
ncbi:MAG: hypothetical protein KKB50_18125 [Planctomycetes bacterium]|nr:hypothetical protein [Planctomycetota bacterium]